jgi:hypothetical protein
MDKRRRTENVIPKTQHLIDLHIEELVLHGFPAEDRYRIGSAVEAELARMFVEGGVPPSVTQGNDMIDLDGGSFEMEPGSKAERVGGQIAKAVYGGLVK